MARITPPLGARGLFVLRAPFNAKATVVYRVTGERSFEDLINRGVDPMKLVYDPVSLVEADYQADVAAGAAIITLMSDSEKAIYVPDTYIDSYPNMGVVPHSWMVATVDLGILPDSYDLTRLTQSVKQAVSDYIGVESTVSVATIPTTDAVTQEQAVADAAARSAAIAIRTTPYAENLVLMAQIEAYKTAQATMIATIEALNDRIKDLEGSAPGG
jgi:hypothetical protein